MITGGHGTAICNYCVLVCMEILIQEVKDNKEIAFPTSSQAEKESTLGKEDKN
jgi:ATP-dependent protease Clp ATPase subunit